VLDPKFRLKETPSASGRCRALGLEDDADASAAQAFERLDRVAALILGDFAAVLRRHRLYPLRSASEFVQALAAECALKHRGTAPIGFRRDPRVICRRAFVQLHLRKEDCRCR